MSMRRITATRSSRILVALIGVGGAIAGASLVLAHSSGAGPNFDATDAFSVFKSLPASPSPAEIANSPSLSTRTEIAQTRLLGSGLGRFQSRLVIFPGNHHQNVCFGLVAVPLTRGWCTAIRLARQRRRLLLESISASWRPNR